ncbi:unnamed protein product [Anisakis simplex]|uniref:Amiloride-sensitive sodium channel n=1 Tax=Anisakis simplex TaxID=6269 RepID=A0A0M3KB91_ANISI|nr:unnamed protein product [Anisakis simplex]
MSSGSLMLKTRGFSLDLLNYLMYAYSPLVDYAQRIQKEEMTYGQQLLDEYVKYHPNFTIRSFVENASQRCEDYILKCLYQGTQFDCCDPNYTTPIMTDLGRCYQTDLEKLHRDINLSYKFGAAQGLQMMLDYRTDEELPLYNASGNSKWIFAPCRITSVIGVRIRRPFLNTFEDGFRIHVHNRMTVSFLSSEIISVSPNNKIAIALRPTKVLRIQFVYEFLERSIGGACRRTWPVGYPKYQIGYSETLCHARCIVHKYVNSCGCAPLRYDILKDQNTCTPKQLHDCIGEKFAIVASTGGRDLMPNCAECAPQCQNFVYYSYCSYAKDILPATVEYLGQLGSRFTPEYVRQNMVGMAVFFESKKFVIYSQSRLSDLTNVLSNIGGNMGLFHGASVISLFELALVAVKVVWSLFSKKRQNYVQSKHMKEDSRKKRLEEILTEMNLYRPEPAPSSETSEVSANRMSNLICDNFERRTSLATIREEDEEGDHIVELSAEDLNIKMVKNERKRGTVSLYITSSLAEALLDRDIAFAKTIRVGFMNNKVHSHFSFPTYLRIIFRMERSKKNLAFPYNLFMCKSDVE